MIAALPCLALVLAQSPIAATQGPDRPDVVVFVIDDVAASDLEIYGGPAPVPNLAELAARGVTYTRAYTHAWCAPTRDSLYYSSLLGYDRGDACAPPDLLAHGPLDMSIAHMMAGQGYATCHIGKYHLGAGQVGPWEVSPELMGWQSVRAATPVGPICRAPSGQPQLDDGVSSSTTVDSSIRCRDAFLEWWAENEGRPRFVVVNFGSAHAPFRFPPRSILPPNYGVILLPTNRQAFEAEIAGVDFVMGQMMQVVGDDAFVIYLGDNGTPGLVPGESPAATVATRPDQDPARVKLTCYEDGVRVPLVIAGPRVVPSTSEALVHCADLMPTLAQIVGIRPRPRTEGRGFAGTLIGRPGPRLPVFVWSPPPRLDRAMIGPRWKLLTRPDGVEELYDLETDPEEAFPMEPVGPEAAALRMARDAILLR